MAEKSLCDRCPLNRICRIRVLSSEVGKPVGDYRSRLKEAVTSCSYHDTHVAAIAERARIIVAVESMFERHFGFIGKETYSARLRAAVYGGKHE